MNDRFGRNINYLRLSLTQRCQQKCSYCSKSVGGKCIKENELTADDFIFIARAFGECGFNKIRLTGGEPLLRRDITEIISGISASGYYDDIAITTNGHLLSRQAKSLKSAGLMRCNISLDSLNNKTYQFITGSELTPVIEGIKSAVEYGLLPLKINCVLIKNVNSNEVDNFISIAKRNKIDVRFIELMPMGDGGEGINNGEILKSHPFLSPCIDNKSCESATYYTCEGFLGRVGFISPMSDSFCSTCNRLRVTNDGMIRPCLGSNLEFSIRQAVKEKDKELLKSIISNAIDQKPEKNCFDSSCGFETNRKMNKIGG